MTSGIELVPLRCSNCSCTMAGAQGNVFLYCQSCSYGYEITLEDTWNPVKVYFAKTQQEANTFFAFWAYDAKLDLKSRESKKGFFSSASKGLSDIFQQRGTIRFYVPAFYEELDSKQSRALDLTYRQPDLEYLPAQKQLPQVAIAERDARKIADDIFLTSEIEQKDTLRSLVYLLHLDNPFLIAIAF